MRWPEYVALALVVLTVGGAVAVIVHDWLAARRRRRPPNTLGKRKPPGFTGR